jgi:protein-tyrosine phosphatase
MGPSHVQAVEALGGGGKAVMLGAFAGGSRPEGAAGDLAVPDPFGGDDEVYEETLDILERYVTLAMKRMAGERG